MSNIIKCYKCGRFYKQPEPREGDIRLCLLQLGERGGLDLDPCELCDKCQAELSEWLHGPMIVLGKIPEAEKQKILDEMYADLESTDPVNPWCKDCAWYCKNLYAVGSGKCGGYQSPNFMKEVREYSSACKAFIVKNYYEGM